MVGQHNTIHATPVSDFTLPKPNEDGIKACQALLLKKYKRSVSTGEAREIMSRVMRYLYLMNKEAFDTVALYESQQPRGRTPNQQEDKEIQSLQKLLKKSLFVSPGVKLSANRKRFRTADPHIRTLSVSAQKKKTNSIDDSEASQRKEGGRDHSES